MHIGFVAHNFIRGNGQGRINYEIARYALQQGHQVTLLADQVEDDLIAEKGVSWERINQQLRRPHLVGGWLAARSANRRLRKLRHKFDVVVGAGFTLTDRHDVNLCQFVHGAWYRSAVHVARLSHGPWAWYQWLYTKCNTRWERFSYVAANIVVAPSEKIRAELIEIGVPSEKVAVIYNGVDLTEFFPRSEDVADPDDRTALGLIRKGTIALFVGDIRTTRKNLDNVLKALLSFPQLHLAVVGTMDKSPFPNLARKLDVSDRVTFLGFRRDVCRLMRAADLFIFPSRYEAGTLVLTEAAASGLPLVTAATAGGCEVFGPEVAEIISDPDDLPALIKAIQRFVSADERRLAAKAARKSAVGLSWAKMASHYLDIFEGAASRRLSEKAGAGTQHKVVEPEKN